jgi:hypothetical protein
MTQPHATPSRRPVEPATGAAPGERLHHHDERDHAVGWIAFAAIVLSLVGVLNAIYGIAAIATSDFYRAGTEHIVGDLATHGWLMLVIGVVQFIAAIGVLAFAQWARWVGVATASANGLVQLLVMPAAPFLALALLTMDVLVVYGLVAYGQRWRDT